MTDRLKLMFGVVVLIALGVGAYLFVGDDKVELPVLQEQPNIIATTNVTEPAPQGTAELSGGQTPPQPSTPPSGQKVVGEEDVSGAAQPVVKPGVQNVQISNFAYFPNSIKVNLGTKVIWTNKDGVAHDVTSDTNLFKSRLLKQGEAFEYTFTKPGTYPYHCSPHPWMTAKIIVE